MPGKRQGPLLQLACTNISSRRFPSPPALISNTTYLSYHSMSHLLASRTPTDTRRSPGSQPAHAVLDPEATEPSGTSPAPFNRDEDKLLSRDPGGVDQGHPKRGPKSQEKEGRIPLQRPGEFDVALLIAGRCHSLTSPQLVASISLHAFPGHQNRQADTWIQSQSPVGEAFSRTIDGRSTGEAVVIMNTRVDKYDMDIRHPQRQRELKVQDLRAVQLLDGFGGLPLDTDDVPPNLNRSLGLFMLAALVAVP